MLPRVPWSAVLHLARLTRVVLFTALLTTPLAAQRQPAWPPLTNFLRIEAPSVVVGDEDSRGPALFGDIYGVTLDGQGNIYVLDFSDRTIRAFSSRGQHIGSAGRHGRGPGDLIHPLTLWHDGHETLYVVDAVDGASRFRTGPDGPRYETRFAAALRPKAICRIGEELVVASVTDTGILHVIDARGTVRRSFGERFRYDSVAGVQEALNMSELKLACDEEANRVFVAEGSNSLVRSYDASGRMIWEQELPDYDGTRAGVNRNPPGIAFFYGMHQTRTITRLGRDLLVVQAQQVSRRRNPSNPSALLVSDHAVITWVLSASTGQVLTRQGGAPFLALTRGGVTAGYVREPVPQVLLTRVHALR